MWSLAVAAIWSGSVAWLLGRAVRQFRLYRTLHPAPVDETALPPLTVVVPARNEAGRIGRCPRGLVAQDYTPDRLQILVVDDNSTDGTGEVVMRTAANDPRVRLLRGGPLPPGWAGKPHACAQGAAAAGDGWLCFLDADTDPRPALLRTAALTAVEEKIDLLSLEPFQELGNVWERLVIPSGMFLMAFVLNLGAVNDSRRPDATANGQFLLFRRETYEVVGGFEAVRAEICEDKALALAVKRAGLRLAVMGAEELVAVRMYTGLRSLAEGLAKYVVDMAGGVPAALAAAGLALVLGWAPVLVPLGAAARLPANPVLGSVALAGSLALLGTHLAGARHFRVPPWYGLLFPLGYTLAAGVAGYALLRRVLGAVVWKGRVYAAVGESLRESPPAEGCE
jgi:chlorobactene glucosyltransferase